MTIPLTCKLVRSCLRCGIGRVLVPELTAEFKGVVSEESTCDRELYESCDIYRLWIHHQHLLPAHIHGQHINQVSRGRQDRDLEVVEEYNNRSVSRSAANIRGSRVKY